MTRPALQEEPSLGRWLRRLANRARLHTSADYRRDGIALLLTNIRALVSMRTVLAGIVLSLLGFAFTIQLVTFPHEGYRVLAAGFALAAVLIGATLFSDERQGGTFELLWLATGSEQGLLRLKAGTAMVLLFVLLLPASLLMAGYFGTGFSGGQVAFSLTVHCWLVLSVMVFCGTMLPQSWAGGLLGAVIVTGLWLWLRDSPHGMNPFLNPFLGKPQEFAANRIVWLIAGLLLMSSSARRLRQALK